MFNPISYLKKVTIDVVGDDPHIEKQIAETLVNKNVLKNLNQSVILRPMAALEAVYADLLKSVGAQNETGQVLPTDMRSFLEATPYEQSVLLLLASSNASCTDPIRSNAAPRGPLQSMEPCALPQSPNAKPIPKEDLEPYCKVRATATIQPIGSPFLPPPGLSPLLPLPSGVNSPLANGLSLNSSAGSSPLVPEMPMFSYPPTLPMLPLHPQLLPPPLFPNPDLMSWFLATGLPPTLPQMPVPKTTSVSKPVQDPSPSRNKRKRVEMTSTPAGSEVSMPKVSPKRALPTNPTPTSSNVPAAPVVRSQASSGSPLQMLERMIPRNIVPPSSGESYQSSAILLNSFFLRNYLNSGGKGTFHSTLKNNNMQHNKVTAGP